MTKQEAARVLDILNIAYPTAFSRMTKSERMIQFRLWSTMFQGEDFEAVIAALYACIDINKFPPTVADIKEHMQVMRPDENDTDLHFCWQEYLKALSGNLDFEQLPEAVRRYVGSKESLKRQSLDEDLYKVLYTVEKSNFYRETTQIIADLKERKYAEKLLGHDKLRQLKEGTNGTQRITGEVQETGRGEAGKAEKLPF